MFCLGDVNLDEHGLAPDALDRGDGVGATCLAPVGDHDPGSFAGEEHGGHLAHAVPGAGDQRDLALESGHVCSCGNVRGGSVYRR